MSGALKKRLPADWRRWVKGEDPFGGELKLESRSFKRGNPLGVNKVVSKTSFERGKPLREEEVGLQTTDGRNYRSALVRSQ